MTTFLDLADVRHSFGAKQALAGLTVRMPIGRVGLLGPNGAGKSTLLKILLGLIPPTSGTGTVLGHPLAHAGIELRRALGYMPESDGLIPGMRGAEYVALAGELYGMQRLQAQRRAHEVLTALDLGEARYRKVEEYSTGMKQRLKLAQALVHDPPALLLDEPTSGLDPAGREAMLDLLLSLGRDHGKAILLSTHLLGDVERVCDSLIILHQGKILAHGNVAELCRRRHNRYILTVQDPSEAYFEDLRLEGVQILHNNERGVLRVEAPDGFATRGFFVLAEHHGVLIRGLVPDDEDLDELFHRLVGQT